MHPAMLYKSLLTFECFLTQFTLKWADDVCCHAVVFQIPLSVVSTATHAAHMRGMYRVGVNVLTYQVQLGELATADCALVQCLLVPTVVLEINSIIY